MSTTESFSFTITGMVTVTDADVLIDQIGPVMGVNQDVPTGMVRLDARTAVHVALAAALSKDGALTGSHISVTRVTVV
ncbi:hypothetical protein [Cellulomonas sp. P5_C6]